MPRFPIQTQLTSALVLFLLLILGVSFVAVASLGTALSTVDHVRYKWIVANSMLGEMTDRISELRVAQLYRVLAADEPARKEAERQMAEHAGSLVDLTQAYKVLVGDGFAPVEMQVFEAASSRFLARNAVLTAAGSAPAEPGQAGIGGETDLLYHEADSAVDSVLSRTVEAADAETTAAAAGARRAITVVVAASIAGVLLTALLIWRVRTRIIGPLGRITSALKQLAEGRKDVQVPGVERRDEIGDLTEAFRVFRSNAEALVAAQENAAALARHDALTGLANRRLLSAELDAALHQRESGRSAFALLVMDLDRFKPVNDAYGHAVGDRVLCEIAERIRRAVGERGLAARIGGDEFAVMLRLGGNERQAAKLAATLAERIIRAVREPVFCDGTRIEVGTSVGVALCPWNGEDPELLLRAADLAMYRAKQGGRNAIRFFEPGMDEDARNRVALEDALKRAVRAGEIEAYFQPQVEFETLRITGFEALARWSHDEKGFIAPDVFIPLAEQLGLMGELTRSILSQACRAARDWSPDVRIAINITPAQFQDRTFPGVVREILEAEQFPPGRLELEITESALVGDMEIAKGILSDLQRLGVSVALDDFGTGYSSLYQLRELKFDRVKIDRSFVGTMHANAESRKITDAILGLARSLGMLAVAEGIENTETLDELSRRGCLVGQGYLFSKAVPATGAGLLLQQLNRGGKDEPAALSA